MPETDILQWYRKLCKFAFIQIEVLVSLSTNILYETEIGDKRLKNNVTFIPQM